MQVLLDNIRFPLPLFFSTHFLKFSSSYLHSPSRANNIFCGSVSTPMRLFIGKTGAKKKEAIMAGSKEIIKKSFAKPIT